MWKIYNDLKGVRLRMPIDLFNFGEQMRIQRMKGSNNYLIKSELNKEYYIDFIRPPEFSNDTITKFVVKAIFGPTAIEYCSDIKEIAKGIVCVDENIEDFIFKKINLNLIGQKKIDYWSFEKEYRFRLFPFDSSMIVGPNNVLSSFISNPTSLTTEYLDISFRKESLEGVEILLGPLTTLEDERKVTSVLSTLNIKDPVVKKSAIQVNA